MNDEEKRRARIAGVLFALVLCSILVFGLWPFGSPRNDVTWIRDRHAVRLGKRGTILSTAPLAANDSGACSVEMWLTPSLTDASATLLAFYDSKGAIGLSIHQSESDLRLDFEAGGRRPAKYYINEVFRRGTRIFLSVVSGGEATQVYINGALVRRIPWVRPVRDVCLGRFVVGDSTKQNNTWQGELAGLAIYQDSLTVGEVRADYQSWVRNGSPDASGGRPADALYLFEEQNRNRILDCGKSRADLFIPERYTIVRQILLETPWHAFEPTVGYVEDVLMNVGGFVPLGVTLNALLKAYGRTGGAATVTVLMGFLVSLTIETLQSRLPTRNSDVTDVITNTIGAAIGVVVYKRNCGLVNQLLRSAWTPTSA